MAPQRLASGSHSNIGKSTIHSGCHPAAASSEVLADLQAQRSQRIAHHFGGICAEENQITVACRGALQNAGNRRIAQELPEFGDCNPSRPLEMSFTLT